MTNCANHARRAAKAQCAVCRKPLCKDCAISVDERTLCAQCVSAAMKPQSAIPSLQPIVPPAQEPAQYPMPPPLPPHTPPPIPPTPPPQTPPGQSAMPSELMSMNTKKAMAATAGSLLIVAGVLGLLAPILLSTVFAPGDRLSQFYTVISGYILLGFVLPLLFSTAALVGGFAALHRKQYSLVVIGGVLGTLSWGFYIGSVLSFIALILILASYAAFDGGE